MTYALVDCNNFFVSCERLFRPQLEGKAVVVLSNNDGCVVARSNESKAMGIRMGTPFFQLKSLVEKGMLEVCSSNYTLYGDISSRVMSVLSDSVPKIEIYSIDEAFLLLDGMDSSEIPVLCSGIVDKVRKWVGVPVSIGVAPSRTLAKIASHFAKKYSGYRGVCRIDSEQKRIKALSMTPVGDIWGVGRRMAVKMEAAGIKTALDFTLRPADWVRKNFMLPGLRTWMELTGEDCAEHNAGQARKSICTSRSFADMIEDSEEIALRVADFAARCAAKLRTEHTMAQDVTVYLHTNRFREDLPQYFPSATVRLPVAASSTREILQAAMQAFSTVYKPGYQYKKAGVVVDSIIPENAVQTSLFDFDAGQRDKDNRLSKIMDELNRASGKELVRMASQRPGHFADGIRCEHRSRLYSTSLDEIIEVK